MGEGAARRRVLLIHNPKQVGSIPTFLLFVLCYSFVDGLWNLLEYHGGSALRILTHDSCYVYLLFFVLYVPVDPIIGGGSNKSHINKVERI